MKSLRILSLLLVIILLTMAIGASAFADEPKPGVEFIEQREYTQTELVTIKEEGRSRQIPVEVRYVEHDYVVRGAGKGSKSSQGLVVGDTIVTLQHSIASQRKDGNDCYLFTVWSGARTITDKCVDRVWAKGSTVGGGTESSGNEGHDRWGCKNDSGMQTDTSTWAQNQTVKTRGDHSVTINGQIHSWDNEDFPSADLPYEHQCTG